MYFIGRRHLVPGRSTIDGSRLDVKVRQDGEMACGLSAGFGDPLGDGFGSHRIG